MLRVLVSSMPTFFFSHECMQMRPLRCRMPSGPDPKIASYQGLEECCRGAGYYNGINEIFKGEVSLAQG